MEGAQSGEVNFRQGMVGLVRRVDIHVQLIHKVHVHGIVVQKVCEVCVG